MPPHILREPSDDDWPTILRLANASVAAVPGAGTQDDWAENRRRFATTPGQQRHWVAVGKNSPDVLGYVGIELQPGHTEGARIFIVTAPDQRETVGESLLRVALAAARANGATAAWMMEYAEDTNFIEFLDRRGFEEARRIPRPDGGDAIVLTTSLSRTARSGKGPRG